MASLVARRLSFNRFGARATLPMVVPFTSRPHPELVEGRTLFLQRLGNTCRAAHRSCVPRQARDKGDGYVGSKIDKRARARKTLDQLRFDQRGALQGLAHRAARGDLQEALALRIVERTLERHPPAEAIDLARASGPCTFSWLSATTGRSRKSRWR